MKKWTIMLAAAALALAMGGTVLAAGFGPGGNAAAFVDENGDGVCDNRGTGVCGGRGVGFVDEDGGRVWIMDAADRIKTYDLTSGKYLGTVPLAYKPMDEFGAGSASFMVDGRAGTLTVMAVPYEEDACPAIAWCQDLSGKILWEIPEAGRLRTRTPSNTLVGTSFNIDGALDVSFESSGNWPDTLYVLEGDVLRPVVGKHHFCGQYEMRLAAEKYRIDFAVNTTDGRRIALELDGFRTHVQEMDQEQFGRQLRRQNELVLAGWQVLRFSFRQLTQEAEACRQMVRRALAADRPPVFTPQPPFRSLGDGGPGKRGAPARGGSARRGV